MADQHDFNIADQSHTAFRADLNSALLAAVKKSNGATEPATRHAYQDWVDTTSGTLKRRNAANNAWLKRDTLAETFVLSRSSNTILAETDFGRTIIATSTFTQTFAAAATLGDGWYCHYRNNGTGIITLDPNSTEQIDGATTQVLMPGESCVIWCNGSAFFTIGLRRITLGTEQATTSGTSIDFTGITAGVKRITIQFVGVSTTGASNWLIQIGDSGGPESSGYLSNCIGLSSAAAVAGASYTAGFGVLSISDTNILHGHITLTLEDAANFTWVASGTLAFTNSTGIAIIAGSKSLSAELDRVRITTVGGTNTFDAGAINISYES